MVSFSTNFCNLRTRSQENITEIDHLQCPPALEERESTTPRDSSFSTRLLIDVNLDTSIPDTYRSPPIPIPFDVVLGIPQSTNTDSDDQKPTLVKVKVFDHVADSNTPIHVESSKKVEVGFQTSKSLDCSTVEEEDICPTCFEGIFIS